MNKVDDKYIEKNLPLVHSLANRFRGRGIDYDDIFSAGCVGLVKAAKGFDESRGLMFSTYAVPVILGEMRRLFRDGGAVKVSRSLKELSLKVLREKSDLEKAGAEPTISQIAENLNISSEQVSEALSVNLPPLSLTAGSDSDISEYDLPVEPEQAKATEMIALRQCMSMLSAEDRRLIILRYWNEKTQSETGKELGMTQVQVSRREKKILSSLKKLMT